MKSLSGPFAVLVFAPNILTGATQKTPIGVRVDGTLLHAWTSPGSYQVNASAPHVLVVGDAPVEANGWTVTRVEAPDAGLVFPPKGNAYTGPEREAHYLWRWAQALGPDAVAGVDKLSAALMASGEVRKWDRSDPTVSPARLELRRRLDRTPLVVAQQLGAQYGYVFDKVAYIPALALVGRLRIAELTNDAAVIADVRRIAMSAPEPKERDGPTLAGHLIFAALAARDNDAVAFERVRSATAVAFSSDGKPLPFVPNHKEMSDAVFMSCPLLAAAGRLTGDLRYYEACLNHLRFVRTLCLRPDGLYRHSPLHETAWGRGNGFPALALALVLSGWPAAMPGRAEVVRNLQEHLAALAPYQDESGMWHQVIDHPESYREFSATCMIAFAMARGVREGWLERGRYEAGCRLAWDAIRLRIDRDGKELVDVCAGTDKQTSLENYLLRPAILGRDDRGGAMALMLAAELAAGG